ncbi:MAG TPA: DUF805 domain-containing protein [Xanthobacteraceae bacterium]|jgi:uncharacterized membrane protein YhaH (DUF805 family)|nr:DUF805 domain-containing protein [Xanthobacteraceae bacterium]
MNFQQAIASGFRNYVSFSGRAIRSEFWYWQLFVFLVSIGTEIIDYSFVGGDSISTPLTSLWGLATFLPGLGLAIRRLHDTDRSGWWFFLVFIPLIGFIVLIIWWCQKGTDGYNRFGADRFKPDGYANRPATT